MTRRLSVDIEIPRLHALPVAEPSLLPLQVRVVF
jgi:hypothetical protein